MSNQTMKTHAIEINLDVLSKILNKTANSETISMELSLVDLSGVVSADVAAMQGSERDDFVYEMNTRILKEIKKSKKVTIAAYLKHVEGCCDCLFDDWKNELDWDKVGYKEDYEIVKPFWKELCDFVKEVAPLAMRTVSVERTNPDSFLASVIRDGLFNAIDDSPEANYYINLVDVSREPEAVKMKDVLLVYGVTEEEIFGAVQREMDIGGLLYDEEWDDFFPFV